MRIVIEKAKRKLHVYAGSELDRSYSISLGKRPVGDKQIEGDGKTPEGEFYVFVKNPESKYFLSLGISYPNDEDAERGLRSGLISEAIRSEIHKAIKGKKKPPQHTALGGEIYIHGGGSDSDWTDGCIALENDEMSELFDAVDIGTSVTILP